jgi:hypothetical protein
MSIGRDARSNRSASTSTCLRIHPLPQALDHTRKEVCGLALGRPVDQEPEVPMIATVPIVDDADLTVNPRPFLLEKLVQLILEPPASEPTSNSIHRPVMTTSESLTTAARTRVLVRNPFSHRGKSRQPFRRRPRRDSEQFGEMLADAVCTVLEFSVRHSAELLEVGVAVQVGDYQPIDEPHERGGGIEASPSRICCH